MILITGASGFLGSHLADYAVARGRSVRALVRPTGDVSALDLQRVEVCSGDVREPETLRAALAPPVSCVVHCAATTSETRTDYTQSFQTNVEGTKNLLNACREQGVQRFIMISTQSANEQNPSTYGRTKLAADRLVQKSGLAYTILKPSTIYGPGSRGLFAKMVRLLDTLPVVPLLGSGQQLVRPIHVFDLCEAILRCESSPKTVGQTYDLGGRDLVSFADFVRLVLEARKKRKLLLPIPLPIGHLLATGLSVLKNPPFTRDNLLGLSQKQICSIASARESFGFRPVGLREGLQHSISHPSQPKENQKKTGGGSPEEPCQKVVVIGLGKMGLMHASNLSILSSVRLVGLVDQDKSLGAHVQSMGLRVSFYDSLDALFAQQKVDAAFVCTPAFTHYPLAQRLVEKNVNVFMEKPLAESLESARKMWELVQNRPGVHAVGYMKGHFPLYQHARRLLQSGVLGEVNLFRSTLYLSQVFAPRRGWVYDPKKSGGGIVANSTCHLLFLLYLLFGELRSVCARTHRLHSEQVEDAASALLEFNSGAVGTLDTSWSVPGYPVEQTEVVVQGSEGVLELTDSHLRLYLNRDNGGYRKGWTRWNRGELDRAAFDLSPPYGGEGYYNEVADFIQACQQQRRPLVSWEEGLKVQKMIDAIYRSAAEGHLRLQSR